MSGNPSVMPSGKSPGLLRLMQQNERKLSEKLKSKKEKSSLKKLKRSEKEAKFEKENVKRKEFRDLQIMFDNMSKKSRKSADEITPKKRLDFEGGSTNLIVNNVQPNLKVKNASPYESIPFTKRVNYNEKEGEIEDSMSIEDQKLSKKIDK